MALTAMPAPPGTTADTADATATEAGTATNGEPSPTAEPQGVDQPAGPPREGWAWTQLTDQGTEIRYATPLSTCPTIMITVGTTTTPHQMQANNPVQPQQFPTNATVCTWRVQDATAAQIDTNTTGGITVRPTATGTVPLPEWREPGSTLTRPSNIAVIGDSGCRVVSATDTQNCQQDWHLQQIANNAAAAQPDLVLHTGDYIYRTSSQVFPTTTCGGPGTSQSVHTWGCLVTDFFEPAGNLLAQAPIVFVRGNHEMCNRSGAVWFRYQATTLSPTCPTDFTPPAQVNVGELHLQLFDSSAADDTSTVDQTQANTYQQQFNTVNANAAGSNNNFLLTHQPLWTATSSFPTGDPGWRNHTLAAGVAQTTAAGLDGRIRLVLSGHVHLYQMLDFGAAQPSPTRPPQATVGSSGTTLDSPPTDAQVQGRLVDGRAVAQVITQAEWGYALLRDGGGTAWNLSYHDRFGTAVAGTRCTLTGTAFTNCN